MRRAARTNLVLAAVAVVLGLLAWAQVRDELAGREAPLAAIDVDAVMRGTGRLRDHGMTPAWGPGRHGPWANVFCYFIAPFGAVIEFSTAVDKVDDDYKVGGPEDWTWPEGRIDHWGLSDKDFDALRRAEQSFRFRRDWQPQPLDELLGSV